MAKQRHDVRNTATENARAQRLAEIEEQQPRTVTGRIRKRVKRLVGKLR
jgi:hypothetical protein